MGSYQAEHLPRRKMGEICSERTPMVDIVTPTVRSKMMSSIRGRDTLPEMRVRRYLYAVGLRFRLHVRDLPGRPDVVFPGRRVAIFVHGCFWHGHSGCVYATTPTTRAQFWEDKFAANKARDVAAVSKLTALGWQVFTVWECETRNELDLDHLAWAVLAMPIVSKRSRPK